MKKSLGLLGAFALAFSGFSLPAAAAPLNAGALADTALNVPLRAETETGGGAAESAFTAGAWALDPSTAKDGTVLKAGNKTVRFAAAANNGNSTTDASQYPAIAINSGEFDFTKAGSFDLTFTPNSAPADSRFGVYLGYANPGSGLFIGYDSGGWFWQKYGAAGDPWYQGQRVAAPAKNAQTTAKISWDGKKATLTVGGQQAFDVDYSDYAAGKLTKKLAMKAGAWGGAVTDITVSDETAQGADPEEPAVDPGEGVQIPDVENAFTITDGTVTATLHPDFPQVLKYELDGKTLAGNVSATALNSVKVNETAQAATLDGEVQKAADSATYTLKLKGIGATITVKVSLKNGTLTWEVTDIKDPNKKVDRIAFPGLSLVTVDGAKAGSITLAGLGTNRKEKGDTTYDVASTTAKTGRGWFAAINNSELAAGVYTNAVADDDTANGTADGQDVKDRWQARFATDGAVKTGTIEPGSFVIYGAGIRNAGKLDPDTLPWAKVRLTADANGDKALDWQDSATATRALMEEVGLPNGYEGAKDDVVMRIPFNIVSQATHPFLRTLDDTKRISLATDNLGQLVLLKGYQAEGHDSAQGDYGSHYNERAGGFKDLVTLLKGAKAANTTYGVHINATESYSEAQCFSDGEHEAAGDTANHKNPCTLTMPPSAAWGWMNQAYYMNSVQDLSSGNVLARFQNFRDELTEAGVEDDLEWLYFDVYYRTGWLGKRLSDEMQKQGWQVGSEWAYAMPDNSRWNHWANDENYGGQENKGINSTLVRYIQNQWRDTWNPDPLLGNTNTVEFEGWTGHTDYDAFINNVWQRNLPTKFLAQSPIKTYKLGEKATFENGTSVTSAKTSIAGKDLGEDREIIYDGATVYAGGAYLLPWGEEDGVGSAKSAGDKLYHYNRAGGQSTWKLTSKFAGTPSFTLYKLTDTGREKVGTVTPSNGSVTLTAEANTAYVLYPAPGAKAQADPNWGEGSNISDPGFYAGDLAAEGYETEGNVSIAQLRANGNRNLGNVAQLGAGKASLSQKLTLPKGDYSMWAWVQIQPGQERTVDVSVSGDAKAIGNQAEVKGVPTTTITKSTAINATASDEKLRTYFQRVRVTFHTDGGEITFKVAAHDGNAAVSVDDLRVVEYTAPKDPKPTDTTIFYDDLESVDTGYWPFVTGTGDIGGDARTQMAERHSPYSDAGWWGKNGSGTVVENGKLTDNVLEGKWSLLVHEENGGLNLRTTSASMPFENAKTYRVSIDYQNAYENEYELVIGRDRLAGGQVISNEVQTVPFKAVRGTGVGGSGTDTMQVEFTTGTIGDYWIGVKRVGSLQGSDLALDGIRVELIDADPKVLPGNVDPSITLGQASIVENTTGTASTSASFFENGTPTNLTTTVSGPEGWKIEAQGKPNGNNAQQTWNIAVPEAATDGEITYTIRYDVDNDGVFREASVKTKVKVVRAIRDGKNYLSDLPWSEESNGWGPVERDQENGEQGANDGTPITMGGVEYPKGIGMHSLGGAEKANITFDLEGKCSVLKAIVGVNDTQPNGNVTFHVIGDGKEIWSSGAEAVTKAGGTKPVDVSVEGVNKLQLQVGNANGSNGNDHANWADAYVICGDEPVQKHTVSYDLAGGTIDGKAGPISEEYEAGSVIEIAQAPVREGYVFQYWESGEDQYQPGDSYTVQADRTFTAVWKKAGGGNAGDQPGGSTPGGESGQAGDGGAGAGQGGLPGSGDGAGQAGSAGNSQAATVNGTPNTGSTSGVFAALALGLIGVGGALLAKRRRV